MWSRFLVKVMFERCPGVGFSCLFLGLLSLRIFYLLAYVLNSGSQLMNEFQFEKKNIGKSRLRPNEFQFGKKKRPEKVD